MSDIKYMKRGRGLAIHIAYDRLGEHVPLCAKEVSDNMSVALPHYFVKADTATCKTCLRMVTA